MDIFFQTKRIGLIFAFASLLTACLGTKEPAMIKVVFLPYLSNAPFFIAQEEGYFKEQGLTIEFAEISRSSEAIPALEKGEVDVVGGALSVGLLNAIYRGANIKLVADKGHVPTTGCGSTSFIASNNFLNAHSSKDPSELNAARIGANPVGFVGYMLDIHLKQGNLSLDDIDIFNNKEPDQFQALQDGTLDLMSASEPWVTRVIQAGLGEIWVSDVEVVPDSCFTLVWYGPNFLSDDNDLGNRFMVAYLKGVAQFNQGKTERNVEIIVKHTGLEEELIRSACWVSINNDGQINTSKINDFQNWAFDKKLIDSILLEEQVWDSSFIEYAMEELGKDK